jgi:hypothetical protein
MFATNVSNAKPRQKPKEIQGLGQRETACTLTASGGVPAIGVAGGFSDLRSRALEDAGTRFDAHGHVQL